MYCKNCGAEFKDDSGFCRSCGYDIEYNSSEVETDEDLCLPVKEENEVSIMEKKQAQVLAEGISSLIFALWIPPVGLVLGIKNLKQAAELEKIGELKGKASKGYVLSRIAKIYSIVWLVIFGVLFTALIVSALLQ